MINDAFSFSCSGTGYPAPNITWMKDGNTIDVTVTPSSPLTLPNGLVYVESTLNIIDTVLEDEGVYSCALNNDAGKEEMAIGTVDIKGIENNYSKNK